MVPCDRILQTAIDEGADLVGLSGLITPSLDEMVFVAKEMERRGLTLPLLIGGATTSRQHTAVKIAPEYGRTTVHVLDASRVVDVVSSLLSDEQRADVRAREPRAAGASCASSTRARQERPLARLRRGARRTAWRSTGRARRRPRRRSSAGARSTTCRSTRLVPYIDWTFFFAAWELKGRFPAILDHPQYGAAARELYDHAPGAARPHRRTSAC